MLCYNTDLQDCAVMAFGWSVTKRMGEFLLTWRAAMEVGIVVDTTEVFTNHDVNSRKAVT